MPFIINSVSHNKKNDGWDESERMTSDKIEVIEIVKKALEDERLIQIEIINTETHAAYSL